MKVEQLRAELAGLPADAEVLTPMEDGDEYIAITGAEPVTVVHDGEGEYVLATEEDINDGDAVVAVVLFSPGDE